MLPEWVEYTISENAAAAMRRRLRGISGSWGELVSEAQTIMSVFHDTYLDSSAQLDDEKQVLPLIAAARILDSASQTDTNTESAEYRALGLTAAVCFAMYGNFPSAVATIRRTIPSAGDMNPAELVIVGTSCPALIGTLLATCPSRSPEHEYLKDLEYFLHTGSEEHAAGLDGKLVNVLLSTSSGFHASLLRSSRLSLRHLIRLSIARVLGSLTTQFQDAYVRRLLNAGVRVFLPPQYRALLHHRLIDNNRDVVIALPTSTGKTLLGELCLVHALVPGGGMSCFIAPYKALARQVTRSLKAHLPPEVHVHRLIGGYREPESVDPQNHSEVVVATPERFDALLRSRRDIIPFLRCVVCDEAHILSNDERGLRFESIITRLKLLKNQGYAVRLVLLSAMLSDYGALRTWLGLDDSSVIADSWRPTARRVAIWKQDGTLTYYVGGDPIRQPGATSDSAIASTILVWPTNQFYPTAHYGQVRSQRPKLYENVAYLARTLFAEHREPILCTCSSKMGTRMLAHAISAHFAPIEPLPSNIASLVSEITSRYPFLSPLAEHLKRGVAYHNASLPNEICQAIEEGVANRTIHIVAATTTLAEGVDLPFRFTIIADWLQYTGEKEEPMSGLLFRNIAGRCGRAGTFTEGDTLIVDNPIGDRSYTDPYNRPALLRKVFLSGGVAELTSAAERLISERQTDTTTAVWASQFVAAIAENPAEEDLVSAFSRNSFFYHRTGGSTHLQHTLNAVRGFILSGESGPFATAASPLRLTSLGTSANVTGLCPDTCVLLLAFLRSGPEPGNLPSLSAAMLRALRDVPEQRHEGLRKCVAGKRGQYVKPEDLEEVLAAWLAGEALASIFVRLPTVRRSSVKPPASEWLAGAPAPQWDDNFDKFYDLIVMAFQSFLPWVMRAAGSLSEHLQGWAQAYPWGTAAEFLELGVDTMWAVAATRADAPASREAMRLIGRRWPPELQSSASPIGVAFLTNEESRGTINTLFSAAVAEVGGETTALGKQIVSLQRWLWKQAGVAWASAGPGAGGSI